MKYDGPAKLIGMHRVVFLLVVLICSMWTGCERKSSVAVADQEQVLIIGNNSEVQSLDPHIATSVADFKVINSLFEGLVRGDHQRDDLYHEGVAQRWEMSQDAKTWTFHLNPDIVWSDGVPLTAYDFDYAYHRLLHPKFGGRYADMLYVLKGAEEYNKTPREEDIWDQGVVGFRVLDAHTIEFQLKDPMPQFPLLLLHCTWFPIPKHCVEQHGGMLNRSGQWSKIHKMVSNGPFILSDHQYNNYLEVSKNARYRAVDQVKLNKVRFLPIVNGFTETRMFFNDKLHITNNVPPEMIAYAKKKAGNEFCEDDYYVSIFYRINTKKPPLNQEKVRQALSMAIDRESLVRDVVRGAGKASYGFTPSGAGYETPHEVKFDPHQAQQLLAEAGFPNGDNFPHLELLTTSREVQRTMAEAIQGMWKKHLNIHIDIRSCEWTAYKQAQNSMHYDLCSSSWSGDYFDPFTFLDLWTQTSGNNNTGWSHPQYEALLNQARKSIDSQERMNRLAEAESLMLQHTPIIPLYWSKRVYLKKSQVQGWCPLLLDNHLLEKISIEQETQN